jgi:hypothetical protein
MRQFACLFLILLVAGTVVAAPITIDVFPALAPNVYGSPNWDGWVANATYALERGLQSYGDPALPAYYTQDSLIPGSALLVTSFPSWMGQADPGTVFGSAFAGEHGNRIHFGLVIDGHGDKISISELSFNATSDDPAAVLNFGYATGTYEYSTSYVGIILNDDGTRTYVTSGPNTQLVDIIVGRGSGNALWPCAPDDPRPCSTVEEQQAALDYWAAYNGAPWHFTGTYTLTDDGVVLAQGAGEVTIDPIPEPVTTVLFGAGLMGMLLFRKRQRA